MNIIHRQEVLKSKFIVKIRHFTFELLTTFLQYHNVKLISAIFNEKILFEFITGYDGSYIKAKLPNYHSGMMFILNVVYLRLCQLNV